jgi:hypothetical protein
MSNSFILEELPDDSLDAILSLNPEQKLKYFSAMVRGFYPKIKEDSEEYINMLEYYMSSFYVEKLYRNNRFFKEKFTPIYTQTGLIRNIVADLYYLDESLITH